MFLHLWYRWVLAVRMIDWLIAPPSKTATLQLRLLSTIS